MGIEHGNIQVKATTTYITSVGMCTVIALRFLFWIRDSTLT